MLWYNPRQRLVDLRILTIDQVQSRLLAHLVTGTGKKTRKLGPEKRPGGN